MSFRSGACQTCKIRKIKCDEGQPSCQRCTKTRRICVKVGIAKPGLLPIHVENRFASGQVKRPRGPRSSFARAPLTLDLETRALAYYLQYHVHVMTKGTNFAGGWSECILEWRNSGKSSHMVDLALSALALMVYSWTQKEPAAATEASSKYAHVLRILQERLINNETPFERSEIDSCLLTIFLMARYEGSSRRPGETKPTIPFEHMQVWSHHDGAMALIKLWYDSWSQERASSIIRQTRRGAMKSHLMRNRELPEFLSDGHIFGEEGLSLEYDGILVRLIKFHHAAKTLEQDVNPSITKIEKLHREGHDILDKMWAWKKNFLSSCVYEQRSLKESKEFPKLHFYSSTVFCHSDPDNAALWCQYFATMMLLLHTIWIVIRLIRADDGWQEKLLNRDPLLQNAADDLASSIPFCLERVHVEIESESYKNRKILKLNKTPIKPYLAGLVVWPLTIASSLREIIDEKTQRWFKSEIAELGRITGDGGLEFAETEQWPRL